MAFHPQMAQRGTGLHHLRNARNVLGPDGAGIALLIAVQHPHLVRPHRVQQERRVAGDEHLRPHGRRPAFLRQLGQQARMQEVLRLLDPDEARRMRVVQHGQVGQHLHRPVRGEAREDRLLERRILELQQQPSIRHRFGIDPLQPRNALAQHGEDRFQPFGVLLLEVLDDVGQVVAALVQALLRPGFRLGAGLVDGQIGHIPVGDELPQRGHAGMLGQLPQRVDRDQVGRAQRDVLALGGGVGIR